MRFFVRLSGNDSSLLPSGPESTRRNHLYCVPLRMRTLCPGVESSEEGLSAETLHRRILQTGQPTMKLSPSSDAAKPSTASLTGFQFGSAFIRSSHARTLGYPARS
jgi:hypothetical protein